MPGWLLRPPGAGLRTRRPTIILNNGNDAQNIGLYVYGAAEAVALGYNALIFEGPGQGSMLFLRGIPFVRLGKQSSPRSLTTCRHAQTFTPTASR